MQTFLQQLEQMVVPGYGLFRGNNEAGPSEIKQVDIRPSPVEDVEGL